MRHNRHTFASLHLTQGAPIAWVSEQMGHSSIEMTVKRYGHLTPGANRHFVNSLPGLKAPNLQPGRNQPENASQTACGSDSSFCLNASDLRDLAGAGDGDRTRDVQLGKLTLN
jgi:hypothetical protein